MGQGACLLAPSTQRSFDAGLACVCQFLFNFVETYACTPTLPYRILVADKTLSCLCVFWKQLCFLHWLPLHSHRRQHPPKSAGRLRIFSSESRDRSSATAPPVARSDCCVWVPDIQPQCSVGLCHSRRICLPARWRGLNLLTSGSAHQGHR